MLISNSIQDKVISHDEFLVILKEKKNYDSLKNEDKTDTNYFFIFLSTKYKQWFLLLEIHGKIMVLK